MSSFAAAGDSASAGPVLLDCDHESVTVAWKTVPNAAAYELSMKVVSDEDAEWAVLSSKLSNNFARKKNLQASKKYSFRVRSQSKTTQEWSEFSAESEAFHPLAESVKQAAAPTMMGADSSSITVAWHKVPGCTGYRLEYRAEHGDGALQWNAIPTTISALNARKKNLLPGVRYYFKVRPVAFKEGEGAADEWVFSKSSEAFTVQTLAPNIGNMLPTSLVKKRADSSGLESVPTVDAVAGKVIGIYFSAHWCGPCRNFTPMLAQVYAEARRRNLPFEVIFCSADHGAAEFRQYYQGSMPWLAVEYDDDKREQIQSTFRVSGIPMLAILSSVSGKVIVPNAAQGGITIDSVVQWVAQL